jgi:ribosomal-protein-alanine N-acetyltransferase
MSAEVRLYEAVDYQYLLDFAQKAGLLPSQIAGLRHNLQANSCKIWLKFKKDRIQGFASFLCCLDTAELLDLIIHPQYRRQGYASFLLQYSLNELFLAGITTCHLEVRVSNEAAIALYESVGFRRVGRRPGYYCEAQTAEDALLFCWHGGMGS